MAKTYPSKAGDPCRSGYEQKIINHLIDVGLPYAYEAVQLTYTTKVTNGNCRVCEANGYQSDVYQLRKYTPDLLLPNGIIVEIKGKFTAQKRNHMRQLVKDNDHRDIRFIFMADNPFGGAKPRKRYSDWARALGIQCAVVPVNWKTKTLEIEHFPEEWWHE